VTQRRKLTYAEPHDLSFNFKYCTAFAMKCWA